MEKLENLLSLSPKEYFWPSVVATSVIGGSLFYLLHLWKQRRAQIQRPGNVDIDHQAISIPNPEGWDIRGSVLSDSGGRIPTKMEDPTVTTVYDNFLRGLRESKDGPCLGWRETDSSPYSWMSYGEVLQKALNIGSGLVKLGLQPEDTKTFIGIYAKNCPEWVITELGAVSQSIAIIPLYDTLGSEAVAFIVNQAAKIAENASATPTLRRLVIFEDKIADNLREEADKTDVKITTFKELLTIGAENRIPAHPPAPESLFIICYTSGTTGLPKGVMITHRNLVLNAASGIRIFNRFQMKLDANSTVISYLPLAHMFEQMVNFFVFYFGAKLGYFRGSVMGLLDDMKVLKPNLFPVVPRLLNRLHDRVKSNLENANPISKAIFHLAYNAKLREMKKGSFANLVKL